MLVKCEKGREEKAARDLVSDWCICIIWVIGYCDAAFNRMTVKNIKGARACCISELRQACTVHCRVVKNNVSGVVLAVLRDKEFQLPAMCPTLFLHVSFSPSQIYCFR